MSRPLLLILSMLLAVSGSARDLLDTQAAKDSLKQLYYNQTPAGQKALALRGWSFGVNWNPCKWNKSTSGVSCDQASNIVSLVIACAAGKQLGGTLPGKLSACSSLQTLSITSCGLVGGLPSAWAQAGAFSSLTKLDLSSNKLSGPLPANLGRALTSLKTLSLASNAFTGGLPEQWGAAQNWMNLQSMNLAGCKLAGSLPAWKEVVGFPSDLKLNICGTALKGPIPSTWDSLAPPYRAACCLSLYADTGKGKVCGKMPANFANGGAGVYPCNTWPNTKNKARSLPSCT